MSKKQMKILVSNDDGYNSKGFEVICNLCSQLGDVIGIAPKTPQSGKAASLSMVEILALKKEKSERVANGNTIDIYSFSGTPVDCVKIAMNTIFSIQDKPDILVSGINHGINASVAAVYSGTIGAAKEGVIYSIPSVAFSIDCHLPDADFGGIIAYFPQIMKNILSNPLREGSFWNINFPNLPTEEIKGIRFAHQGKGMWIKEFSECKRENGESYYKMGGEFTSLEVDKRADHIAVAEGYIAISPQMIDSTDYTEIERIEKIWK